MSYVSFIIPTCDNPEGLKNLLDSLAKSKPKKEKLVLVVDDSRKQKKTEL